MKIAAIDVGTNSFHLLIGQVHADGRVVTLERAKDMVRLGDSAFSTGVISAEAFVRAAEALRLFRRLADRHHCDAIVAVATSATREAENGGDFVRAMRDETGIDLRVIGGEEEARLIYLGAKTVLPFGSRRALLVDIGGGSVEIVVADAREIYLQRSLKLGVLRLLQQVTGDPPSLDERTRLAEFCHHALERVAGTTQRIGFDFVAISSGTARAVYELCNPGPMGPGKPSGMESGRPVERADKGKVVRFGDVYSLEQRLCGLSKLERSRLPGLDARRGDSIVTGVVLVRSLLEVFHADQYILCEAALREGLIQDYAAQNRPGIALVDEFPDLRRRAVMGLLRRTTAAPREPHAHHVARLALDLFRGLRSLHGLPNSDGELLEFAALLHDIGFYIATSKHHKHGQYLIANGGLSGFSDEEVLLMSQTVRYHRKATPKDSHEPFTSASESLQRRIRIHAALLRVADGLDRTGHQHVRSVRCRVLAREIELVITPTAASGTAEPDMELELWSARRKADLLGEVFKRKVRLLVVREPVPSERTPVYPDDELEDADGRGKR